MKHKKIYAALTAAMKAPKSGNLRYWAKNSVAKEKLVSYVKDVTDKESKNFIPVADRVAVFDMDGTFLCETAPYYFDHMLFLKRALHDASYTPSQDDKDFALGLEHWLEDRSKSDNLGSSAPHQSSVFVGTSYTDYEAYVKRFMETPVDGLAPLKWGEAFYLPMVEVIKYLQANSFKVYDDSLVRGSFVIKNLKMNKVSAIVREIGRQPVLAFGNSSGDSAMLNYTTNGNKYRSAAFFLLCDDLERELGNEKKAAKCKDLADANGWTPVSMKDDFKTIYGDNVVRTAKP